MSSWLLTIQAKTVGQPTVSESSDRCLLQDGSPVCDKAKLKVNYEDSGVLTETGIEATL